MAPEADARTLMGVIPQIVPHQFPSAGRSSGQQGGQGGLGSQNVPWIGTLVASGCRMGQPAVAPEAAAEPMGLG